MLFSSPPVKDATMNTFCGFSSLLLRFKPFDEFSPFQNMIANLCVCEASAGACVCTHWIKTLKLSLALFFSAFYNHGRMGHIEVCHRFMLKFKPFKMWRPMSLFIVAILALHVKCHSLQERNVLGNKLIVDHRVKKRFMYIYLEL